MLTTDMLEGNEPAEKGLTQPNGTMIDRWVTMYGSGQSDEDGEIVFCNFSINQKVTIHGITVNEDEMKVQIEAAVNEFFAYVNDKEVSE